MPNRPLHPNIVLLCPDEMAARALGCDPRAYHSGSTPFLTELADRSVRFDQCHVVHTKCTPSRCSLLTGQYPHVNGHRTLDLPTRPNENNLVRVLRDAGYFTALFGKNHVVDPDTMPLTFDHYQPEDGQFALEPADPPQMPIGSYYIGKDPVAADRHVDVRSTTAAINFLADRSAAAADQPFFLWLNWVSPHPPYGTPAPFYGQTPRDEVPDFPLDRGPDKPHLQSAIREAHGLDAMARQDWRELTATYLDMVRLVDAQVRRVFDALEEQGIADDTLVVFWSDHGDFAAEHQLVEKWDTCFYDCLTRVPLIIHAPGRLAPGACPALVESIDILPTMLDLAGVSIPPVTQGRSLRALAQGDAESVHDVVLCQGGQEHEMLDTIRHWDSPRPCRAYQMKQRALYDNPAINSRSKMIRGLRWKYVYRIQGVEELYDLQADPDELHNLANDPLHHDILHDQRRRMMHKLIEAESIEPYQSYLES